MDTNKIKKYFVLRKTEPKMTRLAECGPAPYDAELRNANYGKKVQRGEIDHIEPQPRLSEVTLAEGFERGIDPINLKSRNGSDNITNQQVLRDLRWTAPMKKARPFITKGIHSKL